MRKPSGSGLWSTANTKERSRIRESSKVGWLYTCRNEKCKIGLLEDKEVKNNIESVREWKDGSVIRIWINLLKRKRSPFLKSKIRCFENHPFTAACELKPGKSTEDVPSKKLGVARLTRQKNIDSKRTEDDTETSVEITTSSNAKLALFCENQLKMGKTPDGIIASALSNKNYNLVAYVSENIKHLNARWEMMRVGTTTLDQYFHKKHSLYSVNKSNDLMDIQQLPRQIFRVLLQNMMSSC
eukprot:TRINITY_DN14130_c0_g1_i2.p1 TRINITY_DN14130_c0_g1~~TRINITY_DN14130_c0_g1_i2.p1  ORF type:complete len:241 (+),score=39.53 TRINITY_DN14130_c0_g1_i2:626-1348(+)